MFTATAQTAQRFSRPRAGAIAILPPGAGLRMMPPNDESRVMTQIDVSASDPVVRAVIVAMERLL